MLSTYHIPTTKIRAKQKSTLFNPLNPQKRFSGKFLGIDYAMLPNCEWNQKQKHKKQPWSNVECFAFGVGIVRFASLETSFHAANHTIPPPPSYEGSPLCPKDKNRSPFHGEKTQMTKWFLGRRLYQHSKKRFLMVRTRYFESTEKVQFFKDQNEKCLRFITFLSTNCLNKAMIGRKRRVKRLFLRY